jgi:protein-S-isoprenylcysteine O-methyltransferase Ste14
MRATDFEFRHRFWFIILSYFIGFMCYRVDHLNMVIALARWVFKGSDPNLDSPAARHFIQEFFVLSGLLVAAAAGIRTWAGAYLRAEVVFDNNVHSDRLVADGPYRHVRNPLYLGNILLAIGIAALASRLGAVVLILGNLIIVLRLIGREEAALIEGQGDNYRAFLAAVPRLWPSVRPRLPASGMPPRWAQAFLGEGHLWALALDGFVFAWKLSSGLYYIILGVTAGAYFLFRMAVHRVWQRKLQNTASEQPTPQS